MQIFPVTNVQDAVNLMHGILVGQKKLMLTEEFVTFALKKAAYHAKRLI
jgi:hypothetical protein